MIYDLLALYIFGVSDLSFTLQLMFKFSNFRDCSGSAARGAAASRQPAVQRVAI